MITPITLNVAARTTSRGRFELLAAGWPLLERTALAFDAIATCDFFEVGCRAMAPFGSRDHPRPSNVHHVPKELVPGIASVAGANLGFPQRRDLGIVKARVLELGIHFDGSSPSISATKSTAAAAPPPNIRPCSPTRKLSRSGLSRMGGFSGGPTAMTKPPQEPNSSSPAMPRIALVGGERSAQRADVSDAAAPDDGRGEDRGPFGHGGIRPDHHAGKGGGSRSGLDLT